MEVKIDWIQTIAQYITGVVFIFLKVLLPIYFLAVLLEDIIVFLFCRRLSGTGYVIRNTICQGPDIAATVKYLLLSYEKDRKKVADIFRKDFKELVLKSLAEYPVIYINTNKFVYKNVLLPLQTNGVLAVETISGYRAPQIIEKVQIMDWYSVVRCIWDIKALKRLFRMEMIRKYRLKRVEPYV
ncbi:hypothetical protein [Thermoanaerobacterium sp. DL9XJH110]|uniref:hypothetical protein n=1 Tax=Thermoanaerobacterium sp. DL9XJH110 TaxID=3386643 RepID=UPI003BB6E575